MSTIPSIDLTGDSSDIEEPSQRYREEAAVRSSPKGLMRIPSLDSSPLKPPSQGSTIRPRETDAGSQLAGNLINGINGNPVLTPPIRSKTERLRTISKLRQMSGSLHNEMGSSSAQNQALIDRYFNNGPELNRRQFEDLPNPYANLGIPSDNKVHKEPEPQVNEQVLTGEANNVTPLSLASPDNTSANRQPDSKLESQTDLVPQPSQSSNPDSLLHNVEKKVTNFESEESPMRKPPTPPSFKIAQASSSLTSPREPSFPNDNDSKTPIIVLSDEEDDSELKVDNSRQSRNSVQNHNEGGAGSHLPSQLDLTRAEHERNLREKAKSEQHMLHLKTTYRDTKVILQRKLQKRETLVNEAQAKLDALMNSNRGDEDLSGSSLLQNELNDLRNKRLQTMVKLRKVESKEATLVEQYTKYCSQQDRKIQSSYANLQNAINNRLNSKMVEKRSKLVNEKLRIDNMLSNGSIDASEHLQKRRFIEQALNELHSSQNPSTSQNKDNTIFYKSINVARDLIQKNSVRSEQNKRLMNQHLDVLESFKRSCDRGVRYDLQQKVQVEIAITELFRHGVKMPAVSEHLKNLGFIVNPDDYDAMRSRKRTNNANDDFKRVEHVNGEDDDILEIIRSQEHERQVNQNPLQLSNIYNIQDNDSLHELLEGLKTAETEIEGEELTPPEMTINLMKHQRQGLHWLLTVEKSNRKGGLLADDMGLGKTVQAIALMLANKSGVESCKTNLIVAPVAVLRVWQAEVKTKVKKTSGLKVLIYGGGNGAKVENYRSLLRHDVVLVSYQTLASELKKHWPARLNEDSEEAKITDIPDLKALNSLKERKEYWSPFYCNESKFYRIILDEAQNIKNKKTQSAKACCTLDATYRWALSGTPMQNNIMELYSLIRFLKISPYKREQKFKLDIGNPLGRATNDYDSHDRQQAIKKVQVLLRAIMLRRTKDSKIDGKPILELPEKIITNREDVLQGAELQFYSDLEAKNQKKVEKLLNNRAKGSYSSILTLLLRLRQACCHPELVIIGEHKSESSKVANGKNFHTDWLRLFDVARRMPGAGKEAVADGLESMTCPQCMEQMELESTMVITPCGHMLCEGCSEMYFEDARAQPGARKIVNSGYAVPCPVCERYVNDKEVITYKLYDQAVNQQMTADGLRREYMQEMQSQRDRLKNGYKVDFDKLEPSQKVKQCLDIIRDVFLKSKTEKIIVFSQFTTFFDLLQHFIRKDLGAQYLRYDGSMDSQSRAATIEEFYRSLERRILLISMKAGNAGLTLTCANHVILIDPFWNPFVEEQAMDRCYRISQTRDVQVHRLLVKNSVEDRILELQKKKRELVEIAMDPSKIREVNQLGRRELGFLFGLNALESGPA